MRLNSQYLYELLPAYYRVLDEAQGAPLKAFIDILAREGGIVEDHISQLYENWFIETCEEWVVPYIGDLLGVRGIYDIPDESVFSRRAYVANTLSYRRRKGTAPILEQLALDVTGWRSKAVEFFQLTATTQHLNHVRLHNKATPDLRQMNALELVNSAFDVHSHTIEPGRIGTGSGKYNVMNIGLYLWRLQSYPLRAIDARALASDTNIPEGCYTFNPLGLDSHLFNQPQTERDITHLAKEINVPGPLRRRALFDELENSRWAIVNDQSPQFEYFKKEYPPVFQVYINGSDTPLPPEEITICNLSTWRPAPSTKTYQKVEADGTTSEVARSISAAVDPVLGRISFPNPAGIASVLVDFNYGFSGDLGGGPYDRRSSLELLENQKITWQVGVSKQPSTVPGGNIYSTLAEAIDQWNDLIGEQVGVITVMDSRSYLEEVSGILKVKIKEAQQLYIIAADWPIVDISGVPTRQKGTFTPLNVRPHLRAAFEIEGLAPTGSANGGSIVLNGFLVEGKVIVAQGNLDSCRLQHCTIVPNQGGLEVVIQEGVIEIGLQRCLCGPVIVHSKDARVYIEDSILDPPTGKALSIPNGQLSIINSTVLGPVAVQSLDASNCIFQEIVRVNRIQIGCVRFSYVPKDSITPRRYRCQPDLEMQTQVEEKEKEEGRRLSKAEKEVIKARVCNWLFPVFQSDEFGHHAYGQLGTTTPAHISTGADNVSEMGAFNYLQQPQRETNLKTVLEEYLRLGLEAGLIYVT